MYFKLFINACQEAELIANAEFPDFDVMNCFQVFDMGMLQNLQPAGLQKVITGHTKHIRRLAQVLALDAATLLSQYRTCFPYLNVAMLSLQSFSCSFILVYFSPLLLYKNNICYYHVHMHVVA